MADQQHKIRQIEHEVQDAVGDEASAAIGQRSICSCYSGYGMLVRNNVAFNIYAPTTIQANIDPHSNLVSALVEAGSSRKG